ncbi:tetratricopeptide repeat protein [Calothrix sp. UHCC 0171]|uniref:tetratricopeptide repeat protein n=1 Tax=Calothrix sp. UHCC 0171 TaxID=3110245 RepID=UPI002B21D334|nr:tetratricopeptide repeat protein [Calothrix sp. UHCC 0171]MEA5572836.1 tetratricopeptide repeat protein [Calothrix sp. UHCC 0171]
MKIWKLTVAVIAFGAVASAWKICASNISQADIYNVSATIPLEVNRHSRLGDFEHSLQVYPNNNIGLKKAFNKYQSGDYAGAIADYNLAIQMNPNNAEIYSHRGAAQAGLRKHQEAIKDYKRAIQINPLSVKDYVNRGLLYASLGAYQKAITDYNQSIKINPKYDNAYFNRGVAHYKLGKQQAAARDAQILAEHYKSQGAAVDAEEIMNTMKQFDQ